MRVLELYTRQETQTLQWSAKKVETIEGIIELMSREGRYRNRILVHQYVSDARMTYPEFWLLIQ